MLEFDEQYQPYASNRFCLTAKNGMVATGSHLASQAGLDVLKQGGNAIDAAIATAAALTVVEPTANGLGSDAFALVWVKDQLYGLNASGYAPKNISIEKVKQTVSDGKMPVFGWTPVMVPGAVGGWVELHKRFGKLPFQEVLAPAIRLAKEGYPLSPMLARMWKRSVELFHQRFDGQSAFDEWFKTFTKDGKSYEFGDIVKLENHAKTLQLIADTYGKAFYQGEIADQLVRQSMRDGGYFCKEDLAEYQPQWVDPIKVNYRGVDVYEIPPNGQGLVALMALNILKEFQFAHKEDVETYHKQLEAIKIAFADGKHFITDPSQMEVDYHDFLKPEYGAKRALEIGSTAGLPTFKNPPKSGTVYLCTADGDGNMVSFIQSNYMGFGSGIVVEGYGVSLQNRGADFTLDEQDANCLAPRKKSYHTIIPGFLAKGKQPIGPFGVMGGYMQPQGHVQVVMNMVDFHLNPQMALDAPRWQWMKEKTITVEPSMDPAIVGALARKGHDISFALDGVSFGRGQVVVRLENGVLVGGCESRTDSNIACY